MPIEMFHKSVYTEDMQLFKTLFGMSYLCQTPDAVTILFDDVNFVFNFVHLQAFGADTRHFYTGVV